MASLETKSLEAKCAYLARARGEDEDQSTMDVDMLPATLTPGTTSTSTSTTPMEVDDVCGLDDEPETEDELVLVSSDNQRFTVPKKAAMISELIKSSVDNTGV